MLFLNTDLENVLYFLVFISQIQEATFFDQKYQIKIKKEKLLV